MKKSISIQIISTITFIISLLFISYFVTVLFNNVVCELLGKEELLVEIPFFFAGVYEKIEIFVNNNLDSSPELVEQMLFTIKMSIFGIRVLIFLLTVVVTIDNFNKYFYKNKEFILAFFPSTGLFCFMVTLSFFVDQMI